MAPPAKPGTRIISRSLVKPASISEQSNKPYYLTPWDVPALDYENAQFGLLFNSPRGQSMDVVLRRLKASLAITLTHFFPLAGRIVTQSIQHPPSYCVYIDCNDPAAGAEFVHAIASNVILSDILTPTDAPSGIIESFFKFIPRIPSNHGHDTALLGVQVTQLVDGMFIAFSISHAVVDGTSYWHFINSYSEVCRSNAQRVISCTPITNRWLLSNSSVHIQGSRHTADHQVSVTPVPLPPTPSPTRACRQRVFHFTSQAIARLKRKANLQCHTRRITSYQALVALIWRSVIRVRGLRSDQVTTCAIPINGRSRLEPPLLNDYFGNCIETEFVGSTVDELLRNNLGWAAQKLHNGIIKCDDNTVRSYFKQFTSGTCNVDMEDPGMIFLGSSPRFDVYGNNFGWGKPIGVHWSGEAMDGFIHVVEGRDKRSIDLMVSLFSEFMGALECDVEFLNALELDDEVESEFSYVNLSKI